MSQSPSEEDQFQFESSYADAARQLNKLVRAGRSYSGHERNCCFLNVNGGRFANVSMLSGFDFPEDSRAIGFCDWDADGDLDFWVTNRTAPRIRFMRNDLGSEQNYVSFELRGTTSNRDAVGARVTINVGRNGSAGDLLRTVRAGEGFLAGHSKRVHFGLGDAAKVNSIEVRWPSGKTERFGPLAEVNQRLLLSEGTGQPQPLPAKKMHPPLAARETAIPQQSFATHNLLTEPAPSPPLIYQTFDGRHVDATAARDKPTLVNLWASWCQPCLAELAQWSKRAEQVNQAINLVAVSVDGVSQHGADEAELVAMLQQLGFPGESGIATMQMLDALQHTHNVIYDHHRPLIVPASFLFDKNGWLRAVYKGPVSVDRIASDVKSLREGGANLGLPFTGRWLGEQGTHNLSLLVEELFRDGYENEASAYVARLTGDRLLAEQLDSRLFLAEKLATRDPPTAARHAAEVIKIDPKNATAHERLALILARNGELAEALHHFETATQNANPPHARTHFNFGRLLRDVKLTDKAVAQFTLAIGINPQLAEAHEQLALILAAQQQYAKAVGSFRLAAELQPDEHHHKVNLAMALNRLGRDAEAWNVLRAVVSEEGAPRMALLLGAKSLDRLGRYEEAIPLLEAFLQHNPDAEDIRQQLDFMRSRATQ